MSENNQQEGHIGIKVSFGANSGDFEVKQGATLADALRNTFIREMIGFKGGRDEIVTVNGKKNVGSDQVLQAGDNVEVIKAAGEKA